MRKPSLVERGTYRIIRVDGSDQVINEKPTIHKILDAIGCDTLDTVLMVWNARTGSAEQIMCVDDTGLHKRLPVNEKATELARQIRPGYSHPLVGDVVICDDRDFE
jgi:hypothetical protein